jgi:hypothetical protein
MAKTREAFEKSVLRWRGVRSKEMMGCLTYFRGSKFFAFLVTNGIVLTRLPEDQRDALVKRMKGRPFVMAGRKVSTWIKVPLKKPGDTRLVLPYVRESYEASTATKTKS